ncbi:MAG: hypothetical protein CMH16_30340 [Methylobacterium sp.]|nr:hypothetical protein [Methylobacterium sp.]MBP33542.1 hypothetical protein [Methylobacterium sp.]
MTTAEPAPSEARIPSPVRERDRMRGESFPERPDPSPQPSPARERGRVAAVSAKDAFSRPSQRDWERPQPWQAQPACSQPA